MRVTNGGVQPGGSSACCLCVVWLKDDFYRLLKQRVLQLTLCVLILFCAPVQAQFDRESLSNATVRVVVKVRNQVVAVASGFVWQQSNHVVTSLHVMDTDPNTIVIVEFGKERRLAKVKSILPDADLVLLEVTHPVDNWQPLRHFKSDKPKYQSLLTVLGFRKNAQGMSAIEVTTGYAKPDVLQQLLPSRAVNLMAESGIFSVKLPIYYLDSSLPPGYSGAPVVNQQGELIGIANGGVENGAAQVSWIIPAANLIRLTLSQKQSLPALLTISSALFPLDKIQASQEYLSGIRYGSELISLPESIARPIIKRKFWSGAAVLQPENHSRIQADLSWNLPPSTSREVSYRQLTFTRLKTRSFTQMLASSGRSESITRLRVLSQRIFDAYHIDYPNLLFDVYSDVWHGLNIVVPHSAELAVKDGYLLAQNAWLCQTCRFDMRFQLRQSPPLFMHTSSDQVMSELERSTRLLQGLVEQHLNTLKQHSDYTEFDEVRHIDHYGTGRQIVRAAFDNFDASLTDTSQLNYWVAAHNRDMWFEAQATLASSWLPTKKNGSGTHCVVNHATSQVLKPEQALLCRDMVRAFWVLASTHFTSFANRLY